MNEQPTSKFSADVTWTACSRVGASIVEFWNSDRRLLPMDTRRGSLHVTIARLPARFCTIMCAAFRILLSSGSIAKSLTISSRVVMHAMRCDSTRCNAKRREAMQRDAMR